MIDLVFYFSLGLACYNNSYTHYEKCWHVADEYKVLDTANICLIEVVYYDQKDMCKK